jgi:23S rRNA (cytosine1962-C5)-methyltransferase
MSTDPTLARQAEMLANRVKKNFKHLHKKFEREQIGAFRLYDRDIPEIRAVVDWYEGHVVIGEYARTQTESLPYLETLAAAVAAALAIAPANVHLRRRRTRPGEAGEPRYERLADVGTRIEVRERDLRFLVNLDDYLDTGLFADHRETRARVRAESAGKSFLNLFCYTGSFTAYAVAGEALSSDSVDTSGVYLEWARENLKLNQLAGPAHKFVRADAREFVRRAAADGRSWALALLDPPSFSVRGGASGGDLDVQRDHRELVEATLQVILPGGVLYFSTNHQRFEPALDGLAATACEEITARTVPEDYRNKQVHRCWRIVK